MAAVNRAQKLEIEAIFIYNKENLGRGGFAFFCQK